MSTRSTIRSAELGGAIELGARVEEVDRLVAAGHGPHGLGEQVEPGGVEAAAQGQVGGEPVGVREGLGVIDGEGQDDVRASPATRSIRLLMRARAPIPFVGVAVARCQV